MDFINTEVLSVKKKVAKVTSVNFKKVYGARRYTSVYFNISTIYE
jgi:hypothetical protein